jgi:hypothetical protein
MPNTVSNVTAGKPNPTGAIFRAPIGTTLPTDTDTALDEAFVCLGFCSDDGVTNSGEMDSENIKAWGGQTVLVTSTSTDDTFQFKLIEALNVEVKKFIYGDSNVTGNLTTGMAVGVEGFSQADSAFVIDMKMRDNTKHRIVIPSASISEVGEITYSDSEAVGYDVKLSCAADEAGKCHYEYTKRSA